jgi:hypothetical protein
VRCIGLWVLLTGLLRMVSDCCRSLVCLCMGRYERERARAHVLASVMLHTHTHTHTRTRTQIMECVLLGLEAGGGGYEHYVYIVHLKR